MNLQASPDSAVRMCVEDLMVAVQHYFCHGSRSVSILPLRFLDHIVKKNGRLEKEKEGKRKYSVITGQWDVSLLLH